MNDLVNELASEKCRADMADKEARLLRFGLFEIENRAATLGMIGLAQMAKDVRLKACERGGKAVEDAIQILRKVAAGSDEKWSQKAIETLDALGCGGE